MTINSAIRILRGEVLGTNEQTHEAVYMAIKALKAEPVRHGKWTKINTYEPRFGEYVDKVKCSECGFVEYFNKGWARFKYCPNCGCKMDLDEVNDE